MNKKCFQPIMVAAAACALLAAAETADAGVIRDDVADSFYTALAGQSQFDSVGLITYTTSSGGFLCSGTLVASGWVLTAAHCADDPTTSNMTFTTQTDTVVSAHATYLPDTWVGDPIDGNDIALVQLSEAVTGIDPALIWAPDPPYLDTVPFFQSVTFVGYGTTGDGLTGATQPAGTLRAGENAIDGYIPGFDDGMVLVSDFDNPNDPLDSLLGSEIPLDLEYSVAPGDSGGGVFYEALDDVWALLGVNSFILDPFGGLADADYGDWMGYTYIAPHWDWMVETIAAAPVTDSQVQVPEPASMLLFGTGLAGLMYARRRDRQAA